MEHPAEGSSLGQTTQYINRYDRSLLYPIDRDINRHKIGLNDIELPFHGYDVWNAYEVSWLNERGKPIVALGEFYIPANSPRLIESKSFKLYLNSFNHSRFPDMSSVQQTMTRDLSEAAGAAVHVTLVPLQAVGHSADIHNLPGECLDGLDVEVLNYEPEPKLLHVDQSKKVEETLYSNLLKSNCPVTGQPDWGSVVIEYRGAKIDRASLLKYIISFREHNEFHEHCVERMFAEIKQYTGCEALKIYARYVRRGGLDINPYRADHGVSMDMDNPRALRQ